METFDTFVDLDNESVEMYFLRDLTKQYFPE